MGDALKKVHPGDPLNMSAATFNTFIDVAEDFLHRQRSIGRTPVADRSPFESILLKNASGADQVRYAEAEDAAAKAIVKRPVAAYVEKVYEEGDFAALGIGT